RAGRRVGEDARPVDDLRVLRCRERHLDHVDAEKRGVRIVLRIGARTARQLVARPHGAGSRAVDAERAGILRIRNQRMGVRPAAGLHGGDLLRVVHVADVEDADAAEALRARLVRYALRATVDAATDLLDRHEQQVAVDRDVTLAAWTDERRLELRVA